MNTPRERQINVRLSEREFRQFTKGAAASGMDMSAYLRALVAADLSVSGRPLSLSARLASLELAVREQAAAAVTASKPAPRKKAGRR